MKNIKIAVATHKKYRMPKDYIYTPIHSGAAQSREDLGYLKDNTDDNISEKNPNYSELTALYWLWKNSNAEYKGLVHYRRHFSKKKSVNIFTTGKFEDILDKQTLEKILVEYDIVLPKKRKYYIETIESHYRNTHYARDLTITSDVIEEMYPDYLITYRHILNKRSAHMFNMFIMSNNYFQDYCEWLFPILFEIEERLDVSEYNDFHGRVYGRLSEILLDVWITKNKYSYFEIPIIFMEKQNWATKIIRFLKSKLFKIKY